MKKIAVIGLGYVGLPLSVEFGKTRQVVGFDINKMRVEQLKSGRDVTNECSGEQLKAAKFLDYSSSLDDIRDARIYIVTVPTPIDSVNRPDLRPLEAASKTACQLFIHVLSGASLHLMMHLLCVCFSFALRICAESFTVFANFLRLEVRKR